MRATIVLCVSILALMASFSAANATQIIAMSPQKMGQTASEVVRGSVTSVQSYWNASHTKIFTETVVAVDETYKGSATGQVTLLQLGGEVDGVRVTVHGALSWTAGEEVLLFLEPYTEGRFHVSGFSQGKFAVERDPVTGRAFVRAPSLEGVELVGGDGTAPAAADRKVPLDRFVADALGAQYRPSER
jgi:hypothetical protein